MTSRKGPCAGRPCEPSQTDHAHTPRVTVRLPATPTALTRTTCEGAIPRWRASQKPVRPAQGPRYGGGEARPQPTQSRDDGAGAGPTRHPEALGGPRPPPTLDAPPLSAFYSWKGRDRAGRRAPLTEAGVGPWGHPGSWGTPGFNTDRRMDRASPGSWEWGDLSRARESREQARTSGTAVGRVHTRVLACACVWGCLLPNPARVCLLVC